MITATLSPCDCGGYHAYRANCTGGAKKCERCTEEHHIADRYCVACQAEIATACDSGSTYCGEVYMTDRETWPPVLVVEDLADGGSAHFFLCECGNELTVYFDAVGDVLARASL